MVEVKIDGQVLITARFIKNAAEKVPGVKEALVYCCGHAMEQQINEMTNK